MNTSILEFPSFKWSFLFNFDSNFTTILKSPVFFKWVIRRTAKSFSAADLKPAAMFWTGYGPIFGIKIAVRQ